MNEPDDWNDARVLVPAEYCEVLARWNEADSEGHHCYRRNTVWYDALSGHVVDTPTHWRELAKDSE